MTNHNSKTYQTLKYLFIVISSIALLNCGGGSSGTTVPSGEPEPEKPELNKRPYKFQNNVIYGVDFETDSGQVGTISSDKGFEHNEGDEKITFKIKDLIIGEFNLTKLNADKILLVNDIVGVERDDTINKDVLKILRVLHSLDNDNDLSNGILIDDTTKNLLVGLSEGKTKITENTIAELKALMVKAGKTLVVEKKARDYYKENVLTPMGITPKFNPFTLEVETTSADETFTFSTSIFVGSFSFDYTVDWGDGSKIEKGVTTRKTHEYAVAGTYTIKISGKFPVLALGDSNRKKVIQVLAWGDIAWESFYNMFSSIDADLKTTDTPNLSAVENMNNAFFNSKVSDIDFINDWDVSNVTDMQSVFQNAPNFNQDISKWNVSSVTNMSGMFIQASSFNQDISAWNVENVNAMVNMFVSASKFNQDLSDWNVSNVTDMSRMFQGATSFTNQDLSDWVVSQITSDKHTDFDKNWGSGNTAPDFPTTP